MGRTGAADGITIEYRGLWLLARRPQAAAAVLQAFMDTEMAAKQRALRRP
ncbi:MAG: hypothetical protein IPO59_22415 [Betaproteobacteria bacterium]|nr:hypothetical protein [Betaproteobacteria bacterium]